MRVGLLAARMDAMGGVESVMVRTARHLQAIEKRPVVVTTVMHDEVREELGDIEVRLLGDAPLAGRMAAVERFGTKTMEALADCDAINVHNFPAHIWLDRRAGSRVVVYSCHEPPRHLYEEVMDATFLRSPFNRRPWYTRTWDHWMGARWRVLDRGAVHRAQYVLTNSRYTAGKIKEIYGYSAIPCYFGPVTDGVAVPEDRAPGFRVLFAGRLTPMKNLQTCLRAVALVSQATFHVIGEGDQRPGLEALAASLGISSRVEFLGSVSEARLEEEYARAHAALYIPFDEPMGLIPMEAALREVPSVVSSHAGPAEVVLDGQTGIHVDAKDPASVADGLTRLAADPALRARLGAGARERVRQDMSFDLYAHTLETVLNSALWRVGEEQPS